MAIEKSSGRTRALASAKAARQQFVCPNPQCAAEAWIVEPDAADHDLWHVAERDETSAWTVAASVPICPRCGTTLSAAAAYAGDIGPFAAFINSLDA